LYSTGSSSSGSTVRVLGEGPFDVVIAPGAVSHVEFQWEAAGQTALLCGVADHARMILIDKRALACQTGSRGW
jgi:hypothetical protein